jgi:hypothetical protein
VASPMPRAAPVTSATFCGSLLILSSRIAKRDSAPLKA